MSISKDIIFIMLCPTVSVTHLPSGRCSSDCYCANSSKEPFILNIKRPA